MDTAITFPTIEAAVSALTVRVFGADLHINPVPEPVHEYRTLKVGEVIEKDDECYNSYAHEWGPVMCSVGHVVGENFKGQYRRPVVPEILLHKPDPFFSDLEEENSNLLRRWEDAETTVTGLRRELTSAEARIESLNGHLTSQHVESWAKVRDALGGPDGGRSLCQQTVEAIRERNDLRNELAAMTREKEIWEKIADNYATILYRVEDALDEGWLDKGVEP